MHMQGLVKSCHVMLPLFFSWQVLNINGNAEAMKSNVSAALC